MIHRLGDPHPGEVIESFCNPCEAVFGRHHLDAEEMRRHGDPLDRNVATDEGGVGDADTALGDSGAFAWNHFNVPLSFVT